MNTLDTTLDEIDALRAKLDTLRPLPTSALEKVQEALEIAYTYESNRIEGNTLTLQETALVINEGLTISGKSMKEHLEVINHSEAIDFIKDVASKDIAIDERLIKEIHAIILHSIDKENAGTYRNVSVMISGSEHMPPAPYLIEEQMNRFIERFNQMEADKVHPILIASYLHSELVKIHPFVDGNGRTSRLLMNLYLLRTGYVIINLKGDSDSKLKYYQSLEKSHVENDSSDFDMLVADSELESLKKYIELFEWL